jgi:polyisoprenoid-binding protein YceI
MKRIVALALLAFASVCAAQTQTWQMDPAHSSSQFSVRHLGISTVRGVFRKTVGTVEYDPKDPAKTQIEATIDASSVDTGVETRDNQLRGPNFFDVAKYPAITFQSKSTEVEGPGKLKVLGDLTMHGVTKEVALDVDGPSVSAAAKGGIRMGAEATTEIDRTDFGVGGTSAVVSDEVKITIDVELKRPAAGK